MAEFEPVLTRNWNVPDSHTLTVYESRGGYQASREGPDDDGPRRGRRRRQGLGAARPGRGGVPLRAEVEFPSRRTGRRPSCASTATRASRRRSTTGS